MLLKLTGFFWISPWLGVATAIVLVVGVVGSEKEGIGECRERAWYIYFVVIHQWTTHRVRQYQMPEFGLEVKVAD